MVLRRKYDIFRKTQNHSRGGPGKVCKLFWESWGGPGPPLGVCDIYWGGLRSLSEDPVNSFGGAGGGPGGTFLFKEAMY